MTAEQPTRESIGVLTIAFSPVVREGLKAILTKDEQIQVIRDALDETEAIQTIKRASDLGNPIRLVLTESQNGKVNGAEATRIIKREFPGVAVLVLTENLKDSCIIEAIHAGASGYMFLEDMAPEELLQSIHRAVEGSCTQISTAVLRNAIESLLQNGTKTLADRTAEKAHLTPREIDVLRLMGNGDSNKVIAATLGITLDTTKKHVRSVIDKLQARSRTHASIIAAQAGIVGGPIDDTVAFPVENQIHSASGF